MDLLFHAAMPLSHNPQTSDPNQGIFWIVVGALVVSAVLIVVLVATSRKKGGKK